MTPITQEINLKWNKYYSFLEDTLPKTKTVSFSTPKEVYNFLSYNNVIHESTTILDMGCGNGDFAIEWAPYCKRVHGVDMNPNLTQSLLNKAAIYGITNITAFASSWINFNPLEKFDLAFMSMCPAIESLDDLLKFESMSKKYCCILTSDDNCYDKVRKGLREVLNPKQMPGLAKDAKYYLSLLSKIGRNPIVMPYSTIIHEQMPLEDAITRYQIYFDIFGLNSQSVSNKIIEYLERHCVNGIVHDECHLNTLLILWSIG